MYIEQMNLFLLEFICIFMQKTSVRTEGIIVFPLWFATVQVFTIIFTLSLLSYKRTVRHNESLVCLYNIFYSTI